MSNYQYLDKVKFPSDLKKLSSDNAYVIDTYFHVLDNLYIKENKC